MLGALTYTVYRTAPGQFTSGVWSPGQEEQLTAEGALQPMNARKSAALPEGLRNCARWCLYSKAVLLLVDEATGQAADQVMVNGERLEVAGAEDFSHAPQGQLGDQLHYKYILVEPEDVPGGAP